MIEGFAHPKPGGDYSRVSDLINIGTIDFLPITRAKYRLRESENTEYIESLCLVVRIKGIEILDILEEIS